MAGILVFGTISFFQMGISQMPDVDYPVVNISISWAGASPDVMETAVADVVENAVMSVDGIQTVTSVSQQGNTQVTIEFDLAQDINVALQQVQTKVSQAQKNLPQTVDPPVITKTNPSDQPILWAAAFSRSATLRDLALFVRDPLKDMITTVNGVGDVNMGGFVEPQMRIWLDNEAMKKKDITFIDVINAINNEHQLAPTGYQSTGEKETYVRVMSEFKNADECENLYIPARQGAPIYTTAKIRIGDVARCEEGTDEVRRISRYNGIQPTIGLGIVKQRGTNAVSIADAVKTKIKALNEILPQGINVGIVTDGTVFIRNAVNELLMTLILAVILTSIVCYLFLGSMSSALNVILAIPVSLIGTFIALHFLGFTLNSFTLMGLSLSIGIVVDDAIMVLENISRHYEQGKSRVHAALVGAREITGPATAASLAIIAIFVPVVFMPGMVGKYFFQFGVTLSVAVMISLLEALTLAPMRCSQFLQVGGGNSLTLGVSRWMDHLASIYSTYLNKALLRRKEVILGSFAIFLISLFTLLFLRKEMVPAQDQSRFMATLYTKMGSSLQFTDSVFREAEKIFASRPEIETYYVAVGGFGGGLVNQGISFITMKPLGKRPVAAPFRRQPSQQQFMKYLREELQKIKGLERVSLLDLSTGGFSSQRGFPVEFQVQGPEWGKLADYSSQLRTKLEQSGYMTDVDTDYNPNMPELQIVPNRKKAAEMGVPISTVASGVAAMVGGLKLLPNKYTSASGHRDDIQIKLGADQNRGSVDIKNIAVRNVFSWITPLSNLVDFQDGNTLLTVTRYNRARAIGIFGNFAPGKSLDTVVDYIKKTAKEILPPGYHITLSGSTAAFQESNRSLWMALLLGIFVAFIVLATQFNSFLHPAIILLALPFSITGALVAMLITDTSLNIYSAIGILLLMGIVKKNSILLVEFTNLKREEGLGVDQALKEACPVRLRPILMTSIATIAGAVPAALAHGAGSEIMRPMAVTVIGGVLVSTFLTLFVVPCAYSLCARFERHGHKEELEKSLKLLGET